ncbi:Ff.00g000250.m01.CDS01 [Fusarium sp. VM40]|nr:Ff.00g000250.m01.CDS01 [Fusarium sp. VM40]
MTQRMPTPIEDIVSQCLRSFDLMAKEGDKALRTRVIEAKAARKTFEFRALRQKLFHWAFDSDAFTIKKRRLDDILRGLEVLSATVMRQLEIVRDNLLRVDSKGYTFYGNVDGVFDTTAPLSERHRAFLSKWDDAGVAVYHALDELCTVAAVIKEHSAELVEAFLTTRLSDADKSFQRDIMSVVCHRLPAARKEACQLLADSIAARRMLLLHRKQLSRRSAVGRAQEAVPLVPLSMRTVDTEAVTSMTDGCRSEDDSAGYPPLPKANPGETQVQCPSCFTALERTGLEQVVEEYWKRHIDEDIKPYGCLYPRCSRSLVFFAHRHEWESHMKSKHAIYWMQNVHTLTWFCNEDHNDPLAFETELQWREHVLDPALHPDREELLNESQLLATHVRYKNDDIREKFVCLLCECIPDEISRRIKDGWDSPRIHRLLLSHVACHIKSLSLLAVPSPDTDTEKESVAQPLGGRDLMVHSSTPQEPLPRRHAGGVTLHGDRSLTDPILEQLRFCRGVGLNIDAHDEAGRTMLSLAAQLGNQEWVHRLLDLGASVDLADQDGQTPLLWASYGGYNGIAKLLVDHDVNIHIADKRYGRTALAWAAFNDHETLVATLTEAGGNPDAFDNFGRTLLGQAAEGGDEGTARILMAANADCELRDLKSGRTPLAWAVSKTRPEMVTLFIDHGVNVDALDKSHRTPLSWAARGGKTAIVELLIAGGADIESPHPGTLQTPLALACERGSLGVVEVLLEAGANVEATDSQGWTPLDWALDKGHDEVAKLLNSVGASAKT